MATAIEADAAYPFPDSDLTEDVWSEVVPCFARSVGGVLGVDDPDEPELEVYADGTGTRVVKVRSGAAWLDSRYGRWDAEMTLDIAAPPGTGVRYDRVVLQIDYTAGTYRVAVLTGVTQTGGAYVPAPLTNTSTKVEQSLGVVVVTPGMVAVPASAVIDERTYARTADMKVGAYMWWPTPVPPVGWLLCDGGAYHQTTYRELYVALGSGGYYGAFGSGSDVWFDVPDRRGETLVAMDDLGSGSAERWPLLNVLADHYGNGELDATLRYTLAADPSVDDPDFYLLNDVNNVQPSGLAYLCMAARPR